MKVVIFCGGRGTRLKEETEYKPKPLVMIGNRPILWHIMKIYAHYGFRDFILALGYKGELIREYFLNYSWLTKDFTLDLKRNDKKIYDPEKLPDWNITFVDTGLETKTGGRLKLVERYIKDRTFMATYGDGLANIDINKLIEFHKEKKAMATITGVRPYSKYGVVKVQNDFVKEFKEKPILDDWINGGFMVFDSEIFKRISVEEDCMLVEKTLPQLAKEDKLSIYKHQGYWHCMDTHKDYQDLNKMIESGNPCWMIWKD